MHKVLAALGLAVAVPVALAAPALAKPSAPTTPSVSSVLRQHEGFRAEATYRCTDPKDEEGTISVSLQQVAKPDASDVTTVGTAHEEAKCDGEEREEGIKIPVADGTVRADQAVRVYTTLSVNGKQVAEHLSPAQPVAAASPEPTPSPTSTESATPSPSPSSTEAESESPEPAESESPETETPSPSESESELEIPSPSPTATS